MANNNYGLGRIPSKPDKRNYKIADFFSDLTGHDPVDVVLKAGPVLDQGNTPECVGHASYGSLLCEPESMVPEPLVSPQPFAAKIWSQAQLVDPGYPAPDDGTTIHAAAKVLSDPTNAVLASNSRAFITSYAWSQTSFWITRFVSLRRKPVILGIDWYQDMFQPDPNGLVHLTGPIVGGHAILLYGVSVADKTVRIRNSWGKDWGVDGDFFLKWDDLDTLLAAGGEACCMIEEKLDATA